MFNAKAYLHWYERYGVTADHFQEAFESVQQICDDYRWMCNE